MDALANELADLIKALRNSRTTIVGGLLGALVIWQGNGFQVPTNRQETAALAGGMLIALLGGLAKDGRSGSEAGSPY